VSWQIRHNRLFHLALGLVRLCDTHTFHGRLVRWGETRTCFAVNSLTTVSTLYVMRCTQYPPLTASVHPLARDETVKVSHSSVDVACVLCVKPKSTYRCTDQPMSPLISRSAGRDWRCITR